MRFVRLKAAARAFAAFFSLALVVLLFYDLATVANVFKRERAAPFRDDAFITALISRFFPEGGAGI